MVNHLIKQQKKQQNNITQIFLLCDCKSALLKKKNPQAVNRNRNPHTGKVHIDNVCGSVASTVKVEPKQNRLCLMLVRKLSAEPCSGPNGRLGTEGVGSLLSRLRYQLVAIKIKTTNN